MTAEEFLKNWYPSGYPTSDIQWVQDVPEIIREFCKLKLKEQREIYAENADYIVINRTQVVVDTDSIINSPEPEM